MVTAKRKPYVVGIVGGSASGKTSFLRDLFARLPAGTCSVVAQDNYYRPLAEQARDLQGDPNFDLPTAIERECFHEDLCALVRGESITRTNGAYHRHVQHLREVYRAKRDTMLTALAEEFPPALSSLLWTYPEGGM